MRFWENRKWEKHHPWGIALVVVALMLFANFALEWSVGFPEDMDAKFVLGASITAGSIFTSFLATSLAFFSGVDTPLARRVRKTEYNNDFLSYFRWAISGALGFCALSLLGLFIGTDSILFFSGWVFLAVFSGLAFWRCVYLLLLMLHVDKPEL